MELCAKLWFSGNGRLVRFSVDLKGKSVNPACFLGVLGELTAAKLLVVEIGRRSKCKRLLFRGENPHRIDLVACLTLSLLGTSLIRVVDLIWF